MRKVNKVLDIANLTPDQQDIWVDGVIEGVSWVCEKYPILTDYLITEERCPIFLVDRDNAIFQYCNGRKIYGHIDENKIRTLNGRFNCYTTITIPLRYLYPNTLWNTYKRKRAGRWACSVATDPKFNVAKAVIHEATHLIQYLESRPASEVETTMNELEFAEKYYPQYYAQTIVVNSVSYAPTTAYINKKLKEGGYCFRLAKVGSKYTSGKYNYRLLLENLDWYTSESYLYRADVNEQYIYFSGPTDFDRKLNDIRLKELDTHMRDYLQNRDKPIVLNAY